MSYLKNFFGIVYLGGYLTTSAYHGYHIIDDYNNYRFPFSSTRRDPLEVGIIFASKTFIFPILWPVSVPFLIMDYRKVPKKILEED
jgi:hypothetical protein